MGDSFACYDYRTRITVCSLRLFSRRYRRFSQIFSRYVYFWHIFSLLLRQIIKRNEWEICKSLKIHHRQEKLEESARFLLKSLAINRIFPYFCKSYATGQVKVLAWSGYDAEARQSCGHGQANSSVSWNLVNWNVERIQFVWASPHQYMVWIPLSYFLFYGFYQSLTYKKVLGEGIHAILFSLMNHYGLVQLTTFLYLCPLTGIAASRHDMKNKNL